MMGWYGFLFDRTFRAENLVRYSVTLKALREDLHGQKVAIIGNARALAQGTAGDRIDANDLVIRINRAPMPNPVSHGSKTNWLALSTSLSRAQADLINPDRILWMSHKRKRLPFWVASRPGFYLYPLTDFRTLSSRLGAPPSTGAMIIDLVVSAMARSIELYGFDFFASLSLTGSRTAAQVPHDFSAEKTWLAALADQDYRLKICQ